MPPDSDLSLIAIVGATGSGKSSIAIELALEFGGEIINADSRQVYCGMDIGTAKPTIEDRGRVPHHLYDIAAPTESFSLALFLPEATRAIDDCHARNRLPILVGGTGQYVWGLVEGWTVPEVAPQPGFREEMIAIATAGGPDVLFERLTAVDPVAASSIDRRNVRRVVRALEVHHATGRRFSDLRLKQAPSWHVTTIGVDVPDDVLEHRIEDRVDAMLSDGFADEVRSLLAAGVSRSDTAMGSIGYQQLAAFAEGECSLAEARAQTIRATRRLARRQRQWFRNLDPRITWVTSLAEARSVVAGMRPLRDP